MSNVSLRTSLDRVRARLGAHVTKDLAARDASVFTGIDVATWLQGNTRDPRHREQPFSFQHHEFQTEIVAARPVTVVRKPAQVGLSECSVRMALALAVLRPATHTIYALPTSRFANKFSASRVDPVVESSATLSLLKSRDTWSNELKRLGDSFLHFSGTFGQSQAISVPASTLIKDEVDFCDQGVLRSYASRLEHAGSEAIEISFSTPTVPGFGISAMYERGTCTVRMVCHSACGQWVHLELTRDLVLGGFDAPITSLSADVLEVHPAGGAWLRCPRCRAPIEQGDLADPARRAWVDHYPGREVKSFAVSPFDAAHLNTPASVVARIQEYERPGDWMGFALGLPFENSEVAFLRSHLESAARPFSGPGRGCVAGLDVGRVSWLTIAARRATGTSGVSLEVIHMQALDLAGEEHKEGFVEAVLAVCREYGVVRLVVDALPDLLLVEQLKARLAAGQCWSTYYTVGRKAGRLYSMDEAEHTLSVDRTAWFDRLAQEVNAVRHGFYRGPQFSTFVDHLTSMKRLVRNDRAVWVSTGNAGEDHYAHSFAYCRLAADMIWNSSGSQGSPIGVGMSKVRLNSRQAA